MTNESNWLSRLRRRWQSDPTRTLPGVNGRVHCGDTMLYDESEEAIANYLRAGQSALDNIEKALAASGKSFSDVGACLDFGCGYGRVLRQLTERIEFGKITASDVVEEGVQFCASEFGARPLLSSWNVADLRLGIYDLIWSGSVFTHLDVSSCETLFSKLGQALMPSGGVLVFSFHGQYSLDNLETFYGGRYAELAEEIRYQVEEEGIYFVADASHGRAPVPYGMTWHRRDYLEQLAAECFGDRLRLTLWEAQGWDLHHDVVAFQRIC